ncbi:MAG TPA: O-antigen ligase family protein [Acidimicrobiales bacterium]|nr:O-antigen ligase family protein [Acidimicrobiales bacterium]
MSTSGGRHARSSAPSDARPAVLVGFVAACEFALAWLATSSAMMAATVIVGVLAVISCVLWPSLILGAAFPASFATWRVGPAAIDLSIADLMTFLGVLAAFPSIPWRAKAFRQILWASLAYSLVVGVAVVGHFTVSGAIEVVHRFAMIAGTVSIGAALVHRGKVTPALRALVLVATVVSIAAIIDTLSNDLEPAYAFGLQKNSIGTLLVSSIICVYFGRSQLRWPLWLVASAGLTMAGGLAASQSRGSGLALAAVFVVFLIRNAWLRKTRRVWRLVPLVLLLAAGLGTTMVMSFQEQANERTGEEYKFSSVGTRETTYRTVWDDVITPNPIIGAGPKWFTQPGAPAGEPHNLVLDELSSDGAIGFIAFVAMLWVCLRVANRAPPPLGELAWYAIVARLTAASFDIFWVAGPNTLPFLLLGLGVGASSIEERDGTSDAPVVVPIAASAV